MIRPLLMAAFALVVALGCARLGLWQLDRHQQRSAYNAEVAAQGAAEPIDVLELRAGDDDVRFRRARAEGVLDYEHEVVLANRTRNGAPGVHLITPLRLASGSTILVNRGWVYSPDATHVDRSQWREADSVVVSGYLEELRDGRAERASELAPGVWHRLEHAALQARLPFTVSSMYLVAAEIMPAADQHPARAGMPAMEQGPHLSYAFQWFAFGTIALIGGGVLVVHDLRRRRKM